MLPNAFIDTHLRKEVHIIIGTFGEALLSQNYPFTSSSSNVIIIEINNTHMKTQKHALAREPQTIPIAEKTLIQSRKP